MSDDTKYIRESISLSPDELSALGIETPEDDDEEEQQPEKKVRRESINLSEEEMRGLGLDAPAEDTSIDPASIHSQMWVENGKDNRENQRAYEELLRNPNVHKTGLGLGHAYYEDPETGERAYIPVPLADRWDTGGVVRGVHDAFSAGGRGPAEVAYDTMDFLLNPPSTSGLIQSAHAGTEEAIGDAVTFGAAVADKALGTDMAGEVDRQTPNYDTSQSTVDSVVADGVPAVAATLGGGAGAGAVLKNAPKLIKGVGMVLAGETAGASTMGAEEGTFLLGPDATLPIASGIELGSSDADQILEHRLNTLAEGFGLGTVGAAAAAGAKPAILATKWAFAPLSAIFAKDGVEKSVYDQITRAVTGLGPKATPQELKAARDEVARIIEDNKDVSFKMLDALDQDKTVTLDTIGSLLRGTDPDNRENIAHLENIAQSFLGGDYNKYRVASQRLPDELEGQLTAQQRAIGGPTAADQNATMGRSADALAGQGRVEVRSAEQSAQALQQEYDLMTKDFLAGVRDDPTFGDSLTRLERATGTEISQAGTDAVDNIQAGLSEAYTTLKQQKNDLYSAVEGGDIDPAAIIGEFDRIAGDEKISRAGRLARGADPVNEFLSKIERQKTQKTMPDGTVKMVEEGDDERLARVTTWLNENDADFGFFYTRIRPELSRIASNFYKDQDTVSGDAIRGIIDFIDNDMVEYVAKSDPEIADAADAAITFYRDDFAPIFGPDRKMGEYAAIHDSTINRGKGWQNAYNEKTEQLTNSILQSGDRMQLANLNEVMQKASRPDAVVDYMIADTLESFGAELSIDGIAKTDLSGLTSALRKNSAALRRVDPEKAAQIDQFIYRVNAAKQRGDDLTGLIKEANARSAQVKSDVLSKEISSFFQGQGLPDPMATTSDPYAAFQSIFKGQESIAKIKSLRGRMEGIPEADRAIMEDGLQTAYSRYLRDAIMNRTRQSGGIMPTNNRRIDQTVDGVTQLFEMGDEIFADKPEVMETVKALSGLAMDLSSSRGAKPIASWSPTAFQQDAMKSVNRMINWTLGPLNRAATRTRALASSILETQDARDRAIAAMDKVLADPNEFLRLSRAYNKAPKDPKVLQAWGRWLSSVGAKVTAGATDPDTPSEDAQEQARQVREAFGQGEYEDDPTPEWQR